MTCTFEGCSLEAVHELKSRDDGEIWARLCEDHNKQIDDAIKAGDPKRVVGLWVKAQGGSKKASERMLKRLGL